MDHTKTISCAQILLKVSYSLLKLLLISKFSSRKEDQPKALTELSQRLRQIYRRDFIRNYSFPTFKIHLPLPPRRELHFKRGTCMCTFLLALAHISGFVDPVMKHTSLPRAGEKLPAVTPHRWALPTHTCFSSLSKNICSYTTCQIGCSE